MRILCLGTLCIEFEDAAVTARHVDVFQARFQNTCAVGSLMGFCRTMQGCRKEVVVEVSDAVSDLDFGHYFFHYERPGVIDGWAKHFSGCCSEGCVYGSRRFPEEGLKLGGVTRWDLLFEMEGKVGMELGLLEETLSAQNTPCFRDSL